MSVEVLVQEIFDEPDFQSHGLLSDFRLEREGLIHIMYALFQEIGIIR